MTRRLLASYLTLALVVILVLAVPLAVTFGRLERRNLTDSIEREAVLLASIAEDALEGGATGAAFDDVRRQADEYTADSGGRVVIVDARGDAVVDTSGEPTDDGGSFGSRPEMRTALSGRVAVGKRHSATLGTDLMYVAVPVASGGSVHGAVRVTYPTAAMDRRVHRVWFTLAALGVTVMALVALLGLRFARAIAGPLARVERTAVAAGEGDLTVRADVAGPPEVRSLATRFNRMIARLGDLVKSQEAFVADASHQLRTPLAALRLRLENLETGMTGRDVEGVEAAITEVDRLNRMVDGLLLLARADAGATSGGIVDVDRVVRERVELWSSLAADQGVRIEARLAGGAHATGGAGRLEQVLDNLIENALSALGGEKGAITVRVTRAAGSVVVAVEDDGPGMTTAERARAFDRFWRSDRHVREGTGLGLAIVKRMVEADGGSITLRPAEGGGLIVEVTYPVAPAPRPATVHGGGPVQQGPSGPT